MRAAHDDYVRHYTEKLWAWIPEIYRHEDGLAEHPGQLGDARAAGLAVAVPLLDLRVAVALRAARRGAGGVVCTHLPGSLSLTGP